MLARTRRTIAGVSCRTSAKCSGSAVRNSPATMILSLAASTSQATRALRSRSRNASRIASEMRSQSLSGWPEDTASEVNSPLRIDILNLLFSRFGDVPGAASRNQIPLVLFGGRRLTLLRLRDPDARSELPEHQVLSCLHRKPAGRQRLQDGVAMLDVDSMERAAHPTEFARSESLQNRGRHVAAEFQRQPRWVVSIRESGQAVAGKRLMVLGFPRDIVERICNCCEHDLEHSCVFLRVHLPSEL